MAPARYGFLVWCMWRNSLIREMTFRSHFLLNTASELLWVGMTLIFIKVIYLNTAEVRGWSEHQYLFLVGTHLMIAHLFEAFFFDNCWRFSELVRTGNLDFVLLKPVNTQWLLSFERVNYSALANLPAAVAICWYAGARSGVYITWLQLALFPVFILAGVAILYALLFMFATASVWLIRQSGLDQLWFYATSLARYPAEIYRGFAGGALFFALVFVVPVLLVTNLPANFMVRSFEPAMAVYLLAAAAGLVVLSTLVLRWTLRWYRSASS